MVEILWFKFPYILNVLFGFSFFWGGRGGHPAVLQASALPLYYKSGPKVLLFSLAPICKLTLEINFALQFYFSSPLPL